MYDTILSYIQEHSTAPYGVLESTKISRNMREVHVITFGIARTLDATLEYYNSNFIRLNTSRGYGWEVLKKSDVMAHLKNLLED